jgi:hypothetical protein
VVYFGYYAAFGASLMAAMHTGIYTDNKLPPYGWIMAHFRLCVLHRMQYGNLIYIGIDEQMREIYCIGCRRHFKVIKHAITSVSNLFGIKEHLHFVDARKAEGIIPRVISFFMTHNLLRHLCSLLFYLWVKSKYESCAQMVAVQKELLNAKAV